MFVPLWKKVEIRTGSLTCVVSPGSALVSSHGPLSRDYSESARILIASFPRQLVQGYRIWLNALTKYVSFHAHFRKRWEMGTLGASQVCRMFRAIRVSAARLAGA